MDKERILGKLDEMEQYVGELQSIVPGRLEEYQTSIEIRRASERLLQIIIEAAMDTCYLLVKELKLGLPSEEEGFLEKLSGKILRPSTIEKLREIKRFRNLLVHGYAKIDDKRVFEILKNSLDDLEEFKEQVVKFIGTQ